MCIHNHRLTQRCILLYKFFLEQPVPVYKTIFSPLFLLKAHIASNKMYALQLIIRPQRYNIACDTVTYYGIPFTLEKCFLKIKVLKCFSGLYDDRV